MKFNILKSANLVICRARFLAIVLAKLFVFVVAVVKLDSRIFKIDWNLDGITYEILMFINNSVAEFSQDFNYLALKKM